MDKKVVRAGADGGVLEIPAKRKHFDIVVACEDEEGEDIDVPAAPTSSAKTKRAAVVRRDDELD